MRERLESSVRANLRWFMDSGVMDPQDGSWGVAERLVVLRGNEAESAIRAAFPVCREVGDHAVLEHRRPDCNFEAALLFLNAGAHFGDATYRRVGENILRYLFHRSGLLGVGADADVWNWHSACWSRSFWFDDNGWVAAIALHIAERFPDLDAAFGLRRMGRSLAEKLRAGLVRCLCVRDAPIEHGHWPDPEKFWLGEVRQPHWGGPPCLAMAWADDLETPRVYFRWLLERLEHQNTSECCYALMTAALIARRYGDAFFVSVVERLFEAVRPRLHSDDGTLASEHREAPVGEDRVDWVYTNNWLLVALTVLVDLPDRPIGITENLERLVEFCLSIQDTSLSPAFRGCWRGMYDRHARTWGGGDSHEGGANSIYTGWTNAPMALALLALAARK